MYQLPQYVIKKWSDLFWKASNETRHLSGLLLVRSQLSVLFATGASMAGLAWVVQAGLAHATAGSYAILFQSVTGMLGGMPQLIYLLKDLATQSGFAGELRGFLSQGGDLEPLRGVRSVDVFPGLSSGNQEASRHAGSRQNGDRPDVGSRQENAPGAFLWGGGSRCPQALRRRAFPTPLSREIRFEDVWFSYPDADRPALAGVSFSIRAGQTIALVGENGTGKTTFRPLTADSISPGTIPARVKANNTGDNVARANAYLIRGGMDCRS